MESKPNIQFSSGRRFQSAPLSEVLAPKHKNHGHWTALHPNRFCIAGETAVIFCGSSKGKVCAVRVDREDLVRVLKAGPWRVASFCQRSGGSLYAYTTQKRKLVYLHRFVLDAPPASSGLEVDHRHRRTLDCRKSELRLVSKSLNQRNRATYCSNKFGLRGVLRSRNGKRFIARVFVNYQAKQIGTFDTPEQAAAAVKAFNADLGAIA